MAAKKKVDETHPIIRGLRWILDNRRAPTGEKWSARSLSLAAGLSHSHLGNILSGAQGVRLAPDNALRIANAAGVPLTWLLTGGGGPDGVDAPPQRTVEREERYPTRRQVLAIMKAKGYGAETLAAVESEAAKGDDDPGAQYWVDRVLFWHRLGASVPATEAHADFEVTPRAGRGASTRR